MQQKFPKNLVIKKTLGFLKKIKKVTNSDKSTSPVMRIVIFLITKQIWKNTSKILSENIILSLNLSNEMHIYINYCAEIISNSNILGTEWFTIISWCYMCGTKQRIGIGEKYLFLYSFKFETNIPDLKKSFREDGDPLGLGQW